MTQTVHESLAERLYETWRLNVDRHQPVRDMLGFNRPRARWDSLSSGTQRMWRRIALEASEAMVDEDTRASAYWKS